MIGDRWGLIGRSSVYEDAVRGEFAYDLQARQARHVATSFPLVTILHVAIATLAAAFVSSMGGNGAAWGWLAGLLVIALGCYGWHLFLVRRPAETALPFGDFLTIAGIQTGMLGLAWGTSALLLMRGVAPAYGAIVATIVFGLSGLMTVLLYPLPRLSQLFMAPAVSMIVVQLLISADTVSLLVAVVGIIFVTVLLYCGHLMFRHYADQLAAQADLAATKELLSDALETTSDAFALFDENGQLLTRNRRHRELFRGLDMLRLPRHRPNEIVHTRDDRWLQANSRRIGNNALVATYADITELKRHEQRLDQALRDADAADKAKSLFMALMSHELRTPLNSIIGFSEILEEKLAGNRIDAKAPDQIRHVKLAARHLLSIVNNTLDYSKIEAGNYELRETRFSLGRVIRETLSLMEEAALRKRITVSIDVPDPTPRLQADETAIRQVMLNLLSNAIKFTPEAGTVRVRVMQSADQLSICVIDSGIGIPADQLEEVYKPFGQVRGRPSDGPHQQGTGLGIPLVVRLIELHGGSFRLISEPGEGTEAIISLPQERVLEPLEVRREGKSTMHG